MLIVSVKLDRLLATLQWERRRIIFISSCHFEIIDTKGTHHRYSIYVSLFWWKRSQPNNVRWRIIIKIRLYQKRTIMPPGHNRHRTRFFSLNRTIICASCRMEFLRPSFAFFVALSIIKVPSTLQWVTVGHFQNCSFSPFRCHILWIFREKKKKKGEKFDFFLLEQIKINIHSNYEKQAAYRHRLIAPWV